MDNYLYELSIPAISSLQSALGSRADLMQLISIVFDPKYAFLLYSPIIYLLDNRVGKKLILTTVIAEWANQILKWLLHGERPYWYVHTSGKFDPQQTPIRQFPITCELGPGHPSGHAMVTAAVWYIILDSALQAYANHQKPNLKAKLSVWGSYLGLLLMVGVSRVFLGCHFPHQCLAGAVIGLLVARWVSRMEPRPKHFLFAALFMFITAFGTYSLMFLLDMNPSWTIKLAIKHCVKPEFIHLDTAPLFSIMRYCGFAFGCGLALLFPATPVVAGDQKSRNLIWFSGKLLMALLMARLVDNLGLFVSQSSLIPFYTSAFFAYLMFAFAIINLSH